MNLIQMRSDVLGLLREGESMIDVARLLGVPHGAVMGVLTYPETAVCRAWGEHEWQLAEALLYDGLGLEIVGQASILGIDHTVVAEIANWYLQPS